MFSSDTAYSSQVESRLRALSATGPGATWALKALHPVSGAPTGIPDAVQVSAVQPEYKTTTVISAPTGTTANWDLCLITPPSDMLACYWLAAPAGTDFRGVGIPTPSLGGYLYNSTQTVHNTAFTGLYVNSGVSPLTAGVGTYADVYSTEDPSMWRTTARSLTAYATGSDLYNQGTVYAAQYARSPQLAGIGLQEAGSGVPGNTILTGVEIVDLPLSEADMALMTPNLYAAPAKEGVYSIARLVGPAQTYVLPKGAAFYPLQNSSAGAQVFLLNPTNLTGPSSANWLVRSGANDLPTCMSTTSGYFAQTSPVGNPKGSFLDAGCSWGVIIFRGLNVNMSITLKTVVCLEIVPADGSPNRQFVKPPLKYDQMALAAYYAIANEIPNCVAARHNFFGTLLPIIGSVASKLLPFLAPAAKAAASTLAKTALERFGEGDGAMVKPERRRSASLVSASSMRSKRSSMAGSRKGSAKKKSVKIKTRRGRR